MAALVCEICGGKLMAMGRNATYKGQTAFDLGAVYQGEDKETPCYIQAEYTLKYAKRLNKKIILVQL